MFSRSQRLFGPTGTGGIYVAENIDISPVFQGGTGSLSESKQQPGDMPDLLESGTQNVLGISALFEGVKFASRHKGEILFHEQELAKKLCDNFRNIKNIEVLGRTKDNNTGVVCVKTYGKPPAEVAYLLDKNFGIATRAGFHCSPLAAETLGVKKEGTLRFSPGFFNTIDDIEKASYAMKKIMS